MEKDLELKRWLEHHGRPYLVIATKMDKLNQSEQERGLRAIRKEGVDPLPFSAVNRPGSEGNLASNNENTATTVGNTPPQEKSEKPTEKTPAREAAPRRPRSLPSRNAPKRRTPSGRSAANAPKSRPRPRPQRRRRLLRQPNQSRSGRQTAAGKPAAVAPPPAARHHRRHRGEAIRPSRPWLLRRSSPSATWDSSAASNRPPRAPRTAPPPSTWWNSRT